MTITAQRLNAIAPGRMESRGVRHRLAHPHCTLQELDTEDLGQTMCDAISDDERRARSVRTDEASFSLHQQFLRAHGSPAGEVTTFTQVAASRRAPG